MYIVQRLRIIHFRPISDQKGPSRGSEDLRYDDVCEEQQESGNYEDLGRGQKLARFRKIRKSAGKAEWVKRVEACSFP